MPMASEDRANKPRGFAGLKTWVSRVDLAELQVRSERVANDPDPGSGAQSLRVRHLDRWLGVGAIILFLGWLVL
jgi:hypothetical protein